MSMYEIPKIEILTLTEDILTASVGTMLPLLPLEDEGDWEIV